MSSRAWLVDLIHSIGEKTALTDHLEEKLHLEDSEHLEKIIDNILDLRRSQMNLLLEQAEKPNPLFWCDFKHAVKSWVHDTEVYEANLTPKTKEQMIKSADNLASITSLFLGMEFETCARCLNDKMLVKQIKSKQEETIDE